MHLFNRSGRSATASIASIAVVAFFAAALAGCGGEPDNEHAGSVSAGSGASASSSGAGGGAPACTAVDQACQSSAECCSAACSDGACRPPSCASGESPTQIAAVSTADITSGDQYEIALDADYIYWINGSQRIVRAPVSSVALDPTSVYWAQQADIVRVAKTGGEPATIVNGVSPRAVTISDARLSWIEPPASASAAILTAPKDGGLPTTLVSGPDASWLTPRSFAVDGACLYWIDPNAGVLLRGYSGSS